MVLEEEIDRALASALPGAAKDLDAVLALCSTIGDALRHGRPVPRGLRDWLERETPSSLFDALLEEQAARAPASLDLRHIEAVVEWRDRSEALLSTVTSASFGREAGLDALTGWPRLIEALERIDRWLANQPRDAISAALGERLALATSSWWLRGDDVPVERSATPALDVPPFEVPDTFVEDFVRVGRAADVIARHTRRDEAARERLITRVDERLTSRAPVSRAAMAWRLTTGPLGMFAVLLGRVPRVLRIALAPAAMALIAVFAWSVTSPSLERNGRRLKGETELGLELLRVHEDEVSTLGRARELRAGDGLGFVVSLPAETSFVLVSTAPTGARATLACGATEVAGRHRIRRDGSAAVDEPSAELGVVRLQAEGTHTFTLLARRTPFACDGPPPRAGAPTDGEPWLVLEESVGVHP
ncbi:hypothetical protein L6R52_35890 [Myxococcota bacterium]|nr:hypothetical protein [Myxococcota bacterium]